MSVQNSRTPWHAGLVLALLGISIIWGLGWKPLPEEMSEIMVGETFILPFHKGRTVSEALFGYSEAVIEAKVIFLEGKEAFLTWPRVERTAAIQKKDAELKNHLKEHPNYSGLHRWKYWSVNRARFRVEDYFYRLLYLYLPNEGMGYWLKSQLSHDYSGYKIDFEDLPVTLDLELKRGDRIYSYWFE